MSFRSLALWFVGLSRRERVIVVGGGALVLGAGLFLLVVEPLGERVRLLDQLIARKELDVREMQSLTRDYARAQQRLAPLLARVGDARRPFSLEQHIRELATQSASGDRLSSLHPQAAPPASLGFQEIVLEARWDRMTADRLVRVVAAIERSPHLIRIKRLTLKPRFDSPTELDATLLLATYQKV